MRLLAVCIISLARSVMANAAPRTLQGLSGRPECPCIDPWRHIGGPPKALTYVEPVTARACLKHGDPPSCYPVDYGANRCYAWDVNLPPYCADEQRVPHTNAPNSCRNRWCFVDKSACAMDSKPSTSFPGYNLSYSYATCGDVDVFATEVLVNTLRGRTLRVGVPPGSSPPAFSAQGGNTPPTGWAVDFVNHLAEKGGFKLEIQEISEESKAKFPMSTYTACARDVAVGYLDLCHGKFWETAHRLSMTGFSPIYESHMFYLVIEGKGGMSFGDAIGKIFRPFSLDLWLVMILVVLIVGFAMWLFGEVGEKNAIKGIAMGVQIASLKLLDHGGLEQARTRSGNFLIVGFGIICMLSLASYTANLASFLLMENLDHGISGIQDAINQKVKICTLQAAQGSVASLYPEASSLLVPFSDWPPLVAGMDAGQCGAMLLIHYQVAYLRSGYWGKGKDNKGHCNKVKVGEPVMAIPVAVPINRELDHALSYLWSHERFAGKMEEFKARYPPPPSDCPESSGGVSSGPSALRPEDLAGGLLLIAVFIFAAFTLYIFDKASGRSPKDIQPHRDGVSTEQVAALQRAVADLENTLRASGVVPGAASDAMGRRSSNLELVAVTAYQNRRQLAIGSAVFIAIVFVILILIVIIRVSMNH